MYAHDYHCSVVLALALFFTTGQAGEYHDEPEKVFSFKSRPDIRAPKWNITVHDEHKLSPGYWFVAPYEKYVDDLDTYGWVGPHIYDGDGDLVWSGNNQFDGANIMDFRLQNVSGMGSLTLVDSSLKKGIVLNNRYDIVESMQWGDDPVFVNDHEFQWVDNNTRILVINSAWTQAPVEASRTVGFDGECNTIFESFKELNATTGEETFRWDSYNHIHLTESTHMESGDTIESACLSDVYWDYVHLNAVDKDDRGDFYLSARHTNTIYKISGKDRTVLWRFEGLRGRSDFTHHGYFTFSRQHHVRWRGRNETHNFISLLDNALGEDAQPPSHENSRGLYIALDEHTMVATVEQTYDHPRGFGQYADKRGSFQKLENGNVLMGWSTGARHSEHAPDGTVLMEAVLQPEWLGSYRNYKSPFAGRPTTLPDVYSAAYGAGNDTTVTVVHVSWNGATEVQSWRLYKTTRANDTTELLDTADRTGFETGLRSPGYASYVYVEALDKSGAVLGRSGIRKTITHPNVTASAVQEEREWLQGVFDNRQYHAQKWRLRAWVMFLGGVVAGAALAAVLVPLAMKRFLRGRYESVPEEDVERDAEEENDDVGEDEMKHDTFELDHYDEYAAANPFDQAYR
ncbi:hypothetical protein LTR33_002606 [Friedmanniomyces endolithicus]|nr:hypothetical protein LTR33_002606 [Friedmanniomyces endolithicus]